MARIIKYFLSLCCLMYIFTSCTKVEDNPIPNYRVYLNLDLTFEDKDLKAIPSYKEYSVKDINVIQGESVGYGGVLVVHNMLGEYQAFDRACPYEVRSNVLVEVDNEILYAVCPVCGTKFDIGTGNGSPNGASKFYLLRRNVTQSGTKLIVSN